MSGNLTTCNCELSAEHYQFTEHKLMLKNIMDVVFWVENCIQVHRVWNTLHYLFSERLSQTANTWALMQVLKRLSSAFTIRSPQAFIRQDLPMAVWLREVFTSKQYMIRYIWHPSLCQIQLGPLRLLPLQWPPPLTVLYILATDFHDTGCCFMSHISHKFL